MTPLQIVFWVLVFAVVTAVLYGIGLKKSIHRDRDLIAVLVGRGERKIRKALQGGRSMTRAQLEELLKGTRSSLFYSHQRMTVQDPKPFAESLLKVMVEKGILLEEGEKQKTYRLAEK